MRTATITVEFSEAVTGFVVSSELTATGGTLSEFTGSGTTYTAILTPPTSSTTDIVLSVAADVATDVSSNNNTCCNPNYNIS